MKSTGFLIKPLCRTLAATLSLWVCAGALTVSTPQEFINFANDVNNGKTYKGTTVELLNDIDLNGQSFQPIGKYYTKYFEGVFNGNGHVIKNVKYKAGSNEKFSGLFGYVNSGTISNVLVDNSCGFDSNYEYHLTIGHSGASIGTIAGYCYSCVIRDCVSFACVSYSGSPSRLTRTIRIGGIVGECGGGSVLQNSAFGGNVTFGGKGYGYVYLGGVVGTIYKAAVTNVITTADLIKGGDTSSKYIGIICGEINKEGKLENALYAPRDVTNNIKGTGNGNAISSVYQLNVDDFSAVSGADTSSLDFLNGYSLSHSYTQWGALVHNSNSELSNKKVLSYFVWTGYSPKSIEREGYTFEDWYSDENFITLHSEGPTRWPTIFGENTNIYAKWEYNIYTITFTVPRGNPINNSLVYFGARLNLPTPTSSNRSLIFDEWYEGEQEFNLVRMPARDVTLIAKWIEYVDVVKYFITFNTGEGGSYVGTLKFKVGEPIKIPSEVPTKEGHSFEYWYETDPSVKFTTNIMPEIDLELHAKWSLNTYYIFLDTDSKGSATTIKKFKYGESISLTDATNNNSTLVFDGWFEGDSFFDLDTMPARNVSLTARWEIGNAVKYFIRFVTGEGGSYVGTRKLKAGTNINLQKDKPEKEGCTFSYWYENESSVEFTDSVMPERNLTLHAKWSLNTYYIFFNVTGCEYISEKQVKYSEPTELSDPINENSTLVFDGWFEGDSLFDSETMPARNVSLKAQWKYVPKTVLKHQITFMPHGGSYVNPMKYHEDDNIILPNENPKREGYTFVCWSKENKDTNITCFVSGTMPGKSITLHAIWSINNYTITFNTSDANPVTPINTEYNSPLVLKNATKRGYDFYYWYEDDILTPFSLGTMPARNITLRPYFMSHKYILTFVLLDDNNGTYTRDYVYKEALYTPVPKRTGYVFSHWRFGGIPGDYAESDPFNLTEMPDNDFSVWADWDTSKVVLVYENGDDDDDDSDENDGFVAKDVGSTIDTPYVPQRKGKQFCGWYKDEMFKEPFNETTFDFSSGELVFAKWC